MKEHPILFSGPMVLAILEGRKTMTRRIIKLPVVLDLPSGNTWDLHDPISLPKWIENGAKPRCVKPGDRLWVREHWRTFVSLDNFAPRSISKVTGIHYEADGNPLRGAKSYGKFRPGMFMPRWMSRITLEITDVRAERLQDISKEDSIREGVEETAVRGIRCFVDYLGKGEFNIPTESPRLSFRSLWKSIHGADSWISNPWVWVISFRRI